MVPRSWRLPIVWLAGILFTSCRTEPLAPLDLSSPGWKLRQGQAVWRPKYGVSEIAGELLVASRPPGDTFLQFSKSPLPLVTAQTSQNRWRIEFTPQGRHYGAPGHPPRRLIWLYLSSLLTGTGSVPSPNWRFTAGTIDASWVLENSKTGERFEGYLPAP